MRTPIGLAALLLGLALAAPVAAQDAATYWASKPRPKPKAPPPPTFFDKVKKAAAKAFDINTYLPTPGTTDNSIEDPRLLPTRPVSHIADDIIQVARPKDMPKIFLH
jgi:hypothetical protein